MAAWADLAFPCPAAMSQAISGCSIAVFSGPQAPVDAPLSAQTVPRHRIHRRPEIPVQWIAPMISKARSRPSGDGSRHGAWGDPPDMAHETLGQVLGNSTAARSSTASHLDARDRTAATAAWPGRPTSWTCASTRPGASTTSCGCSPPAAPPSSASPATWRPAAAPAPPSPAGCARSPGSTSTPSKKSYSTTRPPRASVGRAWTTSRMPPGWTATSSRAACRRPGSACPPSTR